MSVLTAARADMCYCPGCSHGSVLEAVGAAIDRSGLACEQVCLVSDIGCIGTADRYFRCHTFHGLHGRSVTYAEGIRRARPEVLPIVLIGDGGCGIGTAHLVHAARRNADIKVIVCNNFNFGMTGGQQSPTTPCDLLTSTTPLGAPDRPLDVCQTVAVNGAAYVARYDALDAALAEHLLTALRTPGFVLVDIWELCTAYLVPGNKLGRGSLAAFSQRCDMPFGVLHRAEARRPRNGRAKPSATASGRPGREHDGVAALPWPQRRVICVAGSAGQRVRSAVGVVGRLTVAGGLFAAQQDDFPITVRRGYSLSNLIVAPTPILYTGADHPDVVVILSADGAARLGSLGTLKPSCRVIKAADVPLTSDTPARVIDVDLRAVEKRVGKSGAALALLAFALVHAECAAPDSLLTIARAALVGAFREENLRAIEAGVELARNFGSVEPGV